jgi:hypothetical protein
MKTLDLQDEALKTIDAFARTHCDGRSNGEVFDIFIYLASRCALVAAVLLDVNEPNDTRCAVCRVSDTMSAKMHELSKWADDGKETDGEGAVH